MGLDILSGLWYTVIVGMVKECLRPLRKILVGFCNADESGQSMARKCGRKNMV